jgi:hypothetical protein
MTHPLSPLLVLLAACACATVGAQPADQEPIEEIVVVGRVPGPPLWRVSNGEHVMWILPEISMVPEDMEWETARVERLIADAQEFISSPDGGYSVTVPKNPVSLGRTLRAMRENTRLPKGQSLADVVPVALYERFDDLKARYFPRDDSVEKLTPYYAAKAMARPILEHENIVPFTRVMSDIDRFVQRNESLRRTDPGYLARDTIKPGELQEIFAADAVDFPPELQLPCLERRISFFESDLPVVKRQATGWALGRLPDLYATVAPREEPDPCFHVPEAMRDEAADAARNRRERWLAAAEAALSGNVSTFAVLGVDDLVAPHGLLAELATMGYTVEISAATAARNDERSADAPR